MRVGNIMSEIENLLKQQGLKQARFENTKTIRLNHTEIERLYNFSKLYQNQVISINSTPTGFSDFVTVFLDDGTAKDITDYDCW